MMEILEMTLESSYILLIFLYLSYCWMVSPVGQVIDLNKAYPGFRSMKLNSLFTKWNVGQVSFAR